MVDAPVPQALGGAAAPLVAPSSADQIVKAAQSLPELLQAAKAAEAQSPELAAIAAALQGKSLLGSKTVWAAVVSAALGPLLVRYGITWDPATQDFVTGLSGYYLSVAGPLVLGILMRYLTKAPITSVTPKA